MDAGVGGGHPGVPSGMAAAQTRRILRTLDSARSRHCKAAGLDQAGWRRFTRKCVADVIPFALIRVVAYGLAAIIATLILGTISSRLLSFDEPTTVLLFGLVIGVINAFIKPVVKVLTLPITCLTFGLFAVIVNAALFYFGASITPGMDVSWWGAMFGSILTSLASGLMFSVVDE